MVIRFQCQLLRSLMVSCRHVILLLVLTTDLYAQDKLESDSLFAKNPYQLSFKDFESKASEDAGTPSGSAVSGKTETTQRAIEMFEKRVRQNAKDYASRAILGELYLRRASENDHLESYGMAIDVLEDALRIHPGYEASRLNMARALMAQHRFANALTMSTPLEGAVADKSANLAIAADCHLELGNYDTARPMLSELRSKEASSPVLARIARFEEIHGHTKQAMELIENALSDLEKVGAGQDERTWYRWRAANLLFDAGKLDLSEARVREALQHASDDEPCLVLLAKISFAKGNSNQAINTMHEALRIRQSPPSMALMGDLYNSLGDSGQAMNWWKRAEACILEEAKIAGDAHAREAAMYYADHDLNLDESLQLIRKDLAQRQDVYTWDAYAWILFKNGKHQEAREAIIRALARHTLDLSFFYHATKIHYAMGELDEAKKFLQRIVSVNPKFSVLFSADIARLCMELEVAITLPQRESVR